MPPGAEFAVRIRDDSLEPVLHSGSVAYLNHDPLHAGDVGIFCVGGDMLCKQYYRDPLGVSYLFSLGRDRTARTSSAALRAESALSASDT